MSLFQVFLSLIQVCIVFRGFSVQALHNYGVTMENSSPSQHPRELLLKVQFFFLQSFSFSSLNSTHPSAFPVHQVCTVTMRTLKTWCRFWRLPCGEARPVWCSCCPSTWRVWRGWTSFLILSCCPSGLRRPISPVWASRCPKLKSAAHWVCRLVWHISSFICNGSNVLKGGHWKL